MSPSWELRRAPSAGLILRSHLTPSEQPSRRCSDALSSLPAWNIPPAKLALMSAAEVQAYRAAQAGTVKLPYLLMAGIFIVVAVAIYFTHLPDVIEEAESASAAELHSGTASVFAHPHLIKGVIAQF